MRKTITILAATLLAALPLASNAQTENPRGIYKLTTLTGKKGEIKAPFDQYKICTDSLTLMVVVQGNSFAIKDTDRQLLNYTGERPESPDDKSTMVYDSDASHFTMKWWSENKGHLYFPDEGWCIEKYVAGSYSDMGKTVIDALNTTEAAKADNPLLGAWRIIGYIDELRDAKKDIPNLHDNYRKSKYNNCFLVFMPQHRVLITYTGGMTDKIEYNGKKSIKLGNATRQVKWLTKDRIAVQERIDYRTDWQILERMDDGRSPLSRVASIYPRRKAK